VSWNVKYGKSPVKRLFNGAFFYLIVSGCVSQCQVFVGASKKVVQKLLKKHTNHARYQLDGAPAEVINVYQIQLATETQAKRAGR
jgi:hypothetical protein